MGTLPPVLHRSARAITTSEFAEALRLSCPPRFCNVRATDPRPVVLGISGGVDSMALAYLMSRVTSINQGYFVADHIIHKAQAVVINHQLREGSGDEARKVTQVLAKMSIPSHVVDIRWDRAGIEKPNELPNIETVARHMRYRALAHFCTRRLPTTALMLAHHQDDQYETVLMRLASGHGYRGLQGMRYAGDIPECYGVHGAHQSGLVDDQRRPKPYYVFVPGRSARRQLKKKLRHTMTYDMEMPDDPISVYIDDDNAIVPGSKPATPPGSIDVEDGGIYVYRPLLHFSKEQLVATCVENGVPWFEDHTNADRTLTMRNAVRHMYRNHELPVALQKPAVLRLAERCRARVAAEEAQADRMLAAVVLHLFEPNVGTAVVELPRFRFPTGPRRSVSSPTGRGGKRLAHYRVIAALLARKIFSMVTPEKELSLLSQLDHLVSLLFPELCRLDNPPPEPKGYVICGVHFVPLTTPGDGTGQRRWLLTRAPHVTGNKPQVHTGPSAHRWRWHLHPRDWPFTNWTEFKLYDGRYWIRMRHKFPCAVYVAPFEPEHHKAFREALGTNNNHTKNDLALTLKRYAPGRIRYTLPAIYASMDINELLAGGPWWETELDFDGDKVDHDNLTPSQHAQLMERSRWERAKKEAGSWQLLALPTMGYHLPGVDRWIEWEVRYRKVDEKLLKLSVVGSSMPRRRREVRKRVRAVLKPG